MASDRPRIRARDWLLLLIAAGEDAGAPGLDAIRLQKGMFLLDREAGLPAAERYRFVPYNYGPMSRGVYRGARRLVRDGLVQRRRLPGHPAPRYVATAAGRERARELEAAGGPAFRRRLARLREIRAAIAAMSFEELLRDIYRRYPDYAVRSVFEAREPGA